MRKWGESGRIWDGMERPLVEDGWDGRRRDWVDEMGLCCLLLWAVKMGDGGRWQAMGAALKKGWGEERALLIEGCPWGPWQLVG